MFASNNKVLQVTCSMFASNNKVLQVTCSMFAFSHFLGPCMMAWSRISRRGPASPRMPSVSARCWQSGIADMSSSILQLLNQRRRVDAHRPHTGSSPFSWSHPSSSSARSAARRGKWCCSCTQLVVVLAAPCLKAITSAYLWLLVNLKVLYYLQEIASHYKWNIASLHFSLFYPIIIISTF